MTALVGASVFLIAGSAIALLFGWITADESLIWTSIAASVAGAVCLALAYHRARTEVGAARAAGPAERGVDAEIAAAAAGAPAAQDVVVIRRSKRFHRPDCRYATSKNAEEMNKTDALSAGFMPCGICKP